MAFMGPLDRMAPGHCRTACPPLTVALRESGFDFVFFCQKARPQRCAGFCIFRSNHPENRTYGGSRPS